MKFVLPVIGCGLLATAIVLGISISKQGPAKTTQEEHVWKEFTVTIDATPHTVLIREYPQPVAVQSVMADFAPSESSRYSALGTLALSTHLGRNIQSKADLEAFSHLFENPKRSMERFEWLQTEVGGWDELIDRLRKSTERRYRSRVLLAEAIVLDQHVFVCQMPDTGPMYQVLRKQANGQYLNVNEWDESIRPLLFNDRILELFEGVQLEQEEDADDR